MNKNQEYVQTVLSVDTLWCQCLRYQELSATDEICRISRKIWVQLFKALLA